jgi:hypothetical protein
MHVRSLTQRPLQLRREFQSKSRIEVAAVVFSATDETCDCATDAAHAWKLLFAVWTAINIANRVGFRRERQIVTTDFISDVEIAASVAPFDSVRGDSLSPDSKLRQQMRELVPKRALNLTVTRRKSLSIVLSSAR